jgi:tellurite resistance protein TehA-like permease
MSAPVAPARGVIETWHPGWLGVVLGTSGVAMASLMDPVGSTTADQVLGALLAAAATVLLVALAVPYVLRLRRHRNALLADLSHPGLGAMFGTVPAAMLIVGVTLAHLGVVGWLPPGVAWISALLTILGVAGALLVGVEFFSRVVAAEQA